MMHALTGDAGLHSGELPRLARQTAEGLKEVAEHRREVCEVNLSQLDAVLPPKGFGRD